MSIVRCPKPPKVGSSLKNFKIALRLKEVCYKVSLCENCQRHSCKAFIVLTMRAKMIAGERSLLPEFLGQTDGVGAKLPIFHLFSLVSP